jgi:hypothetical protein
LALEFSDLAWAGLNMYWPEHAFAWAWTGLDMGWLVYVLAFAWADLSMGTGWPEMGFVGHGLGWA